MITLFKICCISIILSFVLFLLKEDIPFITYLIISCTLLSLSYTIVAPNKYNLKSIFTISLALLCNLAVFLYFKSPDYSLAWDKTDIAYAIYTGLLIIVPLFIFIKSKFSKKEINGNSEPPKLFTERENDLKLISGFLDNNHEFTFGINAIWGEGKTFLINEIKKNKAEFEYITIDLLSSTIDTIEQHILSEFNKLFERKKIYSSIPTSLKQFFNQDFFLGAQKLIYTNPCGYSELYGELKKELSRTQNKVVLIFDDVDRIKNKEIVYKIFAISEKLASSYVKICFLYNEMELLNILEEKNRFYLDKYIPFQIHLTPIHPKKIIERLITSENFNVRKDSFDFLFERVIYQPEIRELLKLSNDGLLLLNYPIRSIKNFLIDINNLSNNKLFIKNEKTVIIFFFIKHFLYDFYNELDDDTSIEDVQVFKLNAKKISINKIISNIKKGEYSEEYINLFDNSDNRVNLAIYSLLGYTIHCEMANIGAFEKNDKINEVFRKLLYNGNEGITKLEKVKDLFIEKVLNYNDSNKNEYKNTNKDEGINDVWNYIQNEASSIQKKWSLPIKPNYETIFLSFGLFEDKEDYSIALTNWFVKEHPKVGIETFPALKHLKIISKDAFLRIIDLISSLGQSQNFYLLSGYTAFLRNFLRLFTKFGYTNELKLWKLDGRPNEKEIASLLKAYEEEIHKEYDSCGIKEIYAEATILLKFVNFNQTGILSAGKTYPQRTLNAAFSHQQDGYYYDYAKEIHLLTPDEMSAKCADWYKGKRFRAGEIVHIKRIAEKLWVPVVWKNYFT